MIAIYCPTYGRPGSLQRLVDNVSAVTTTPHRVVFVVESDDSASSEAASATGATVLYNEGDPGYPGSIQTAFDNDDSEFFVTANDDFDFQAGWDTEALAKMVEGVCVVGLNDGSGNGVLSTIAFVRRSYIVEQSGVVDMPGRVFGPYGHNFADTEFYATAVGRGVFASAPESVVVHMHPDFGRGQWDGTYHRSRTMFGRDARTFSSRRHLWEAVE